MRIIVGLFLVFTLQSCFAQQTSPAGLQSLNSDVLVWAAAWRLPNTTSVASWDAFNNKALSAAGTAPTLLANPFNNSVPGVSFSGSQCMKSTTIGATDSLYSVYVAATLPGAGVHVLAAQEESVSVGYALILSHNGTTIELSFNMNGFPLGSVSAEAGLYIQGDPMLFWYSQDVSYGTLGFDTLSNSFSSDSTTLNTVTTAVGCDLKGDHLTGVVGEVLVLKTGGNNTAAHNIITNSLAARFGITGFPNKIYTGATDQNGNSKDDVSGIGSEPTGTVLSGNSVQLTVSRQTALPDGDYIMFGRVPDDGELFTFPLGNYTIFSRVWFVTVSVQGQINQQATADLSFDVSTVKDILSANDSSYFVVHQPTSSAPYQIIAQNGVVSADNNTVTFSGVSLSTGYLTVGSTVRSTPLPTPSSGPVAGPVAGPSAPIASAPVANAYPSPGIIRRSGAVGTAVSVFSAVMLIACLLF